MARVRTRTQPCGSYVRSGITSAGPAWASYIASTRGSEAKALNSENCAHCHATVWLTGHWSHHARPVLPMEPPGVANQELFLTPPPKIVMLASGDVKKTRTHSKQAGTTSMGVIHNYPRRCPRLLGGLHGSSRVAVESLASEIRQVRKAPQNPATTCSKLREVLKLRIYLDTPYRTKYCRTDQEDCLQHATRRVVKRRTSQGKLASFDPPPLDPLHRACAPRL